MSGDRKYTASSNNENEQQRPAQSSRSNMQLNADAQEWYPANHMRNASTQAHAAGTGSREVERERILIPCCRRQYREAAAVAAQSKPAPNAVKDFEYLQKIIERVTADPGHFEVVVDILMQTLQVHFQNSDMMASVSRFIFAQGIDEQSFRYNAGRLCVLLQKASPLFQGHMENLFMKEMEKSRNRPGYSLFLAELFTQSKFGNWKVLYNALNKLISYGGDEGIKTVCQSLKLAGFYLDAYNRPMMDSLIGSLEQQKQCVQKPIYASLIDSVMNLRLNKWGHEEEEAASNGGAGATSSYNPYANLTTPLSNGSVRNPSTFYGPGGVELTEADRQFMNEAFDDPDELYDPDNEMDPEVQAAFKEFVKMNK